jgi:hypothetical protein
MMDNKEHGNRRANFAIFMTALMGVWVLGGFVALMFVHWDAIGFTTKGHLITIWMMVAFLIAAGVYFAFARMSRLRVTAWIIVALLVMLEVYLGISYFSW